MGLARKLYHLTAIPRPSGTLAALAGERVAGMANWRLYRLCQRSGDWQEARDVLEQMLNRRQMQGSACTALAKLYEHRFKDYGRALEYARRSARYPDGEPPELLEKRVARLRDKLSQRQTQR